MDALSWETSHCHYLGAGTTNDSDVRTSALSMPTLRPFLLVWIRFVFEEASNCQQLQSKHRAGMLSGNALHSYIGRDTCPNSGYSRFSSFPPDECCDVPRLSHDSFQILCRVSIPTDQAHHLLVPRSVMSFLLFYLDV